MKSNPQDDLMIWKKINFTTEDLLNKGEKVAASIAIEMKLKIV